MKQTQLSVITKTAGLQTCAFQHLQIWIWEHKLISRLGLWLGFDYRRKGTVRPDLIIFHSIHGNHTSIFMVRKLWVYPQLLIDLIYTIEFVFSIVSGVTCFIKSIKFTWNPQTESCTANAQNRHFCRWFCAGDHWLEDYSAPSVICEVVLKSQLALALASCSIPLLWWWVITHVSDGL